MERFKKALLSLSRRFSPTTIKPRERGISLIARTAERRGPAALDC